MSDLDEVVARIRFALEHPNDDVVTVGDVTTLLDAYESAVRERDEVRVELDRYNAVLGRIADPETRDGWSVAVLALLDREAPDGE